MEKVKNILFEYIKKYGMKNTQERYIVLDFVLAEEESFTISDILAEMCDERICRATIYNCISVLERCGIITPVPNILNRSEYIISDEIKDILKQNDSCLV